MQKGENFIYEFTPDEPGDILFTCWMGSGCHKNYIHVKQAESPALEDFSSAEVEAPESTASVESAPESADENAANTEISSTAESTSSSESSAVSSSASEVSSKADSTSSNTNTAAAKANNNPQTGINLVGGTLASILMVASTAFVIRKRKN